MFPNHRCRTARYLTRFGYDTPLPKARQVLLGAIAHIEGIMPKPAAEMDVIGFGESSINFVLRYWTLPQKAHVRRIQSQVVLALEQACDEVGFNIPFSMRTLHFPNQPSNDGNSLIPVKQNSSDRHA